ncbi:MAG TPA: DUF1778 domain-containing protein [Solirubrobacteraceae bacterium]|jgi:uncharacterized protein (DUF1778 family)|nr:DUF1778 domain-containing protein [Solirubrobacteraceae bacterium]
MATTSPGGARRHRIEVRVTPDQEALIRYAASLADETVTAFVLGTATERARRVVEAHRTVTLSNETFDRFYAALDEPAAIVPEVVDLLRSEPLPRG